MPSASPSPARPAGRRKKRRRRRRSRLFKHMGGHVRRRVAGAHALEGVGEDDGVRGFGVGKHVLGAAGHDDATVGPSVADVRYLDTRSRKHILLWPSTRPSASRVSVFGLDAPSSAARVPERRQGCRSLRLQGACRGDAGMGPRRRPRPAPAFKEEARRLPGCRQELGPEPAAFDASRGHGLDAVPAACTRSRTAAGMPEPSPSRRMHGRRRNGAEAPSATARHHRLQGASTGRRHALGIHGLRLGLEAPASAARVPGRRLGCRGLRLQGSCIRRRHGNHGL